MADLGCQDTDWVGGNVKAVLDAILLRDGLILATLTMDERKRHILASGALRKVIKTFLYS